MRSDTPIDDQSLQASGDWRATREGRRRRAVAVGLDPSFDWAPWVIEHDWGGRPLPQPPAAPAEKGEPFTAALVMADCLLNGHGKMAEDAESQAFERETLRLNPGWKPGRIPKVPAGYRNGVAVRRAAAARAVVTDERPVAAVARPRERRAARSHARRGPPSSEDDPPPLPAAAEKRCGQRDANNRRYAEQRRRGEAA
jgi:hypothetical protein